MEILAPAGLTLKEWFVSARPKTLPAAVVPFIGGTFLAYAQATDIEWHLLLFAIMSAISIQVGMNLTNDAYDFVKGADIYRVLGPDRPTRAALLSGRLAFRQVLLAGGIFFVAALLFGVPLIVKGGAVILVSLVMSVVLGFGYTGGPFPIAYLGLGDIFVFSFYGVVAVNIAYWLQTGSVDADSFQLSLQVGCLCTSMIAVNNLRDVEDDGKANKKTLPVRLGVFFGKTEIALMLIIPLLLNLLWPWPAARWLPFVSTPLAVLIILKVAATKPSKEYNKLLALSGVNMLVFCILLAAGFAFA